MSRAASLNIGTRASLLARWQTDHVISRLQEAWPELTCAVATFSTAGDRIQDRPLPAIGGKGLFTEELENGLRSGEIDIAVHSLKDLPVADPAGLTIGALLSRADVRDILISRDNQTLQELPRGAVVGTSSLRRQAQLLAARPDLNVRSIRGNVQTRIRKVMDGEYDATILAAAGVDRLGLHEYGGQLLSLDAMLPAPGQGALAVQCRAGDEATLALLAAIHDERVRGAVTAERSFLLALGGGCAVPVAAHAIAQDGIWQLQGLVADPAGAPLLRVSGSGSDPLALGQALAKQATADGAAEILDRVKPLRSRRIVVTRSAGMAGPFVERLATLGAEPILFPVIDFLPVDPKTVRPFLLGLDAYDWLIFSSANAVRFFFEQYDELHSPPPLPKTAAVGQVTADLLRARGVAPDYVPDVFSGEALAAGLGDLAAQQVLLPRARAGRPETVRALQKQGAVVVDLPLYETIVAEPGAAALAEIKRGVDVITFTSPSSVRSFVTLIRQAGIDVDGLLTGAVTVCIGPSTAAELAANGRSADLVAATYTTEGMIEALINN